MQQWIKEVARGKRGAKDLSYEQTRELARFIVEGKATDAQIAAYFIAERIKMESPEELLAFVQTFQENTDKLTIKESIRDCIVDFAGAYTGRNLFAATVPASILLAESGLPAFLHSSESLPPRYGTSIKEIVEELGVNTNRDVQSLSETIDSANIGFAWADRFCPSLAQLRSIREELGVRTLMNTVEKLLNISNAKSLMMGAFHRTAIVKIAPIFASLPYENVYIVQGVEGSEDLPVHRNSFIYTLKNNELDSFIVKPDEYGLFEEEKKEKLTRKEQADIILALLSGETSEQLNYYYKQVLFNTGIRYYLFGAAPTIEEGIALAKEQLRSQRGMKQLQKWKDSCVSQSHLA
ncbi:anthranilate phosphoribosyltransferase [Peribacillus asahii]|uniref:Glycosyl transferase n=1 Tax=Peribacillus asahii TaxID=228899 RepID=A0A3Q9RKG2_9BACI|nr:anthranilate phosphoribosyltransferase [Peribacillus asahii]AZV41177.1 glycosyl transferase [Peribacillus asahii]USK85552.1 anthranilate phosphoribosyltransferase [Peribacillus asahii]